MRWWGSRRSAKNTFGGLPVQQRCEKLLCGVAVVDIRSGREVGLFEFTAGCEELYDVAFLPGVHRPMILNLQKPAVRQAITNPEASYWLRRAARFGIGWKRGAAGRRRQGPGGRAVDGWPVVQ